MIGERPEQYRNFLVRKEFPEEIFPVAIEHAAR